MKNIKTTTGFSFKLNEKILDDMRLVQQIRKLEQHDTTSALNVLEKLVGGADNFDKLLGHLEKISDDGIAHSDALLKELTDILNVLGDNGKKS